jgi:formylglycine-generating enzyme required for sulfatase activity
MLRSIQTLANGTAMTREESSPPKKPRNRARASVEGDGAVAQGNDAVALGKGASYVGGDSYQITLQQAAQPGASAGDLRQGYLAWLSMQANRLPLFVSDSGKPVQLASVYTALLTEGRDEKRLHPAAGGSLRQPGTGQPGEVERLERLSALEALDRERHLVLMGGPGSGKTTFLNFVALCLAGEILREPGANLKLLRHPIPPEEGAPTEKPQPKPKPQRWRHGAPLPVRVVLRDFAASLPPPGTPAGANDLWTFIVGQLPASLPRYADHLSAELLGQGGLILLDGLDEVPDALQRREQVKSAVQEFAATHARCRFLVTSRTYAYQRQDWKLDGFAERELLPFTRGQVERFIDGWYQHMAHDLFRISEAQAAAGAAMLKRATIRPELRELAARPLLLTLMARLQTRGGGSLPENREELYRQSVAMLLDEWEGLKLQRDASGQPIGVEQPSLNEWLNASRENIRRELDKLAYEAHLQQPTLLGTADIRQGDLIAALLAASRDRPDVRPVRLEDHLRDRTGLLTAHGEGLYQFPHRSFQEYLAACHLARFKFPDTLSCLAKADPNRWREVTLLSAAGFRNAPGSIWELVDALCTHGPDPAASAPEADSGSQWGALLAGQVLHETGLAAADPDLQERHERKRLRVRDWQLRLLRSTTLPGRERALAGDLLAALGETRQHLLDVDQMRFALVPRGPFWMGDEGVTHAPLHRNETLRDDYWIAVAPVTVAQFAQFVAASACRAHDPDALRYPPNRPVVEVSWHDACAFCDWLSERWRDALPSGWSVGLPSEAEWEKAARGGVQIPQAAQYRTLQDGFTIDASPLQNNPEPQRAWPWGGERDAGKSNAENGIGETSTPGCFELGCSPYGCEDLAGNVWEWTRSLWGSDWEKPDFVYPYDARDLQREDLAAPDDILRVVRGGSWIFHRGFARCASRLWSLPGGRYDYLGFRVVLRSSPVR